MTEIIEIINLPVFEVERKTIKCDSCNKIVEYAYTCSGCSKRHACEKCRDYFVNKDTYRDYCPMCIELAEELIDKVIKLEKKADKVWKKIFKIVKGD